MLARKGFYQKKFPRVVCVNKRKYYNGFSLTGNRAGTFNATSSKNCFVEDGKLRRAHGVGRYLIKINGANVYLPTVSDTKGVVTFFPLTKGDQPTLGYVTEENRVDYYNPTTRSYKIIGEFPSVHQITSFFDEKDEEWILICYGEGAVAYSALQDKSIAISSTEVFSAETFHERLFLAKGVNLSYGVPINTFDFSDTAYDSGTIRLPSTAGKIKRLKAYRERLYAFCENGIWRIDAGGAASDFVVERIDYVGGKIYEYTLTPCGEKLVFVAGDGVYLFDGSVAERMVDASSLPLNKFSKLWTGYYGGRLYMTFVYSGKTQTLFFNLDDVTDRGECFAMTSMSDVNGELVHLQNGYPSRLFYNDSNFPTNEESFITAKGLDFFDLGEKRLRSVTLTGEGSGDLIIEGRGKSCTVHYQLTDGTAEYEAPLKGKKFSLRLTLALGTALSGIRFDYDKLGG